MRRPAGAAARAARSAGPTPPAIATWLSLSRIPSKSPTRWLVAPPSAVAYLSSRRQPGRVLRVSTMRAPLPATASTKRRASVAIPQRRPRKLSAVRSPARIARRSPATSASAVPAPTRSPSRQRASKAGARSSSRKTASANGSPHTTSAWRASMRAAPRRPAATTRGLVTSPGPRSSSRARRTSGSQLWEGGRGGRVAGEPRITPRVARGLGAVFALHPADLLADQGLGHLGDHFPGDGLDSLDGLADDLVRHVAERLPGDLLERVVELGPQARRQRVEGGAGERRGLGLRVARGLVVADHEIAILGEVRLRRRLGLRLEELEGRGVDGRRR